MKKRVDVYLVLLFVWFTLDLTGLSVSNFTKVKGTGFLGVNGIWWAVYSILMLIYFFGDKSAEKLLLVFLSFWLVAEYFKEWHFIFKQEFFTKEIQNEMIYLPDMYYLILEGFIIVSLSFLIKYIFFEKKKTYIEFVVREIPEEEIQEVLSVE